MWRIAWCFAALLAFAAEPGFPTPPTAAELIARAQRLWRQEQDLRGALAAFDEAVAADPAGVDARFQRGTFLFWLWERAAPEQRDEVRQAARADFDWLDRHAEDSIYAGIARDIGRQLDGEVWFAEADLACPQEAVEAMGQAESLYASRRFETSLEHYRRAVEACPASGAIRTAYADAVYALGEYALAARLFREALAVDPWRRTAHRYLADAEVRLGRGEAALRECVLAIVSDPTYEAAWSALHGFAEQTERGWRRVRAEKPRVEAGTGEDGQAEVSLALPGLAGDGNPSSKAEQDEAAAWLMYGLTKAGILGGSFDREGEPVPEGAVAKPTPPGSRLALERAAVRKALLVLARPRRKAPPSFWGNIRQASEAGLLDAAIFLTMMDRELAAEYPAYRETHGEDLVRFVETILVPKSGR